MFSNGPAAPPAPNSTVVNARVAVTSWAGNAARWFSDLYKGRRKRRLRYADQAVGEEQEYPLFDADKHRKYYAHLYFQSKHDKHASHDEKDSPDESTLPRMTDPKRSAKGHQAYHDFLRGLEMINQQEYLSKEFCGEQWDPKTVEENDPKFYLNQTDREPVKYDEKTLWEKACWERSIVLRRHAASARSFYEQLKARALEDNALFPKTEKHEDGTTTPGWKDRENPLRRPPIRWKTFELLTRPLEADWNTVMFLAWCFTIFTYIFTLVTQIQSVANMCSHAYLCPIRDVQIPLIAPPFAFRRNETNALYYWSKFGDTWDPQLRTTCKVGTPGCTDPGYHVQWPYMQVDWENYTLPAPLLESCTLRVGEAGFWIWDPFERELKNEYLDCSGATQKDSVPFQTGDPETPHSFHFTPNWYNRNQQTTRGCMVEAANKFEMTNVEEWASDEDSEAFTDNVEMCVGSNSGLSDLAHECACSTKVPSFPITHFYANGPLKTCQGGAFDGTLCDDDDQCEDASCVARYEQDHHDLATSPKFGCFFESPTEDQREQVRFHICGMSLDSKVDAAGNTKSKLQRAVGTRVVSKKAGLMIVFAIKEASYLTGFFVIGALWLGLAIILSPVILIGWILHKTWDEKFPFSDSQLLQFKDSIGTIIWVQTLTLWSTCVNFSTFYRMIKFAISLTAGHVNVSIHDLDKKLTGIANLMFNLVLLVFEDSSDSNSVYASIGLSLVLLLYQMNSEKQGLKAVADVLKDINEHRLSKFETALGLVKVMEDLLEYDIEYNWVGHFYSDQKLYPVEAQEGWSAPWEDADKEDADNGERKETLRFMPVMSKKDAKKWGHDGRGQYNPKFHNMKDEEFAELEKCKLTDEQLDLVFTNRPGEDFHEQAGIRARTASAKYTSQDTSLYAKQPAGEKAAQPAGEKAAQPTDTKAKDSTPSSLQASVDSTTANFQFSNMPFGMPGMPNSSIQNMSGMQGGYNPYGGYGGMGAGYGGGGYGGYGNMM